MIPISAITPETKKGKYFETSTLGKVKTNK